jgi:hypothetical protein
MVDWAPDVSAISPDRYLLLQLVKLKKYQVEAHAWRLAHSLVSVENLPVAEYMLDKKKDAVAQAQTHDRRTGYDPANVLAVMADIAVNSALWHHEKQR